jgi:hypothetical protein
VRDSFLSRAVFLFILAIYHVGRTMQKIFYPLDSIIFSRFGAEAGVYKVPKTTLSCTEDFLVS